jgi:energy-coupling factor transport system permease protein
VQSPFRRLASPLHATRAPVGAAYCLTLGGVALAFEHPAILAADAAAVLLAAAGARVGRQVLRWAMVLLPMALLIALINPLFQRDGLTVVLRLGEVPVLGRMDLTLEALLYGVVLGVRLTVVALAGALLSAAVDPDGLLRAFRRVSPRSALTAVLTIRLMPVLARDARRVDDARRCRADSGGTGAVARMATLRALTTGALERAVDVAATLEVRGYGGPEATRRGGGTDGPWSRHDLGFAAAVVAILVLVVAGRSAGWTAFDAYPSFDVPMGAGVLTLCAALVAIALLPFLDRRGIA